MSPETPPHWDLTNVYPSLDSKEYSAAVKKLTTLLDEQKKFLAEKVSRVDASSGVQLIADTAGELVQRYNDILLTAGTLRAFVESFVTTNSFDKEAQKKQSELEQILVNVEKLEIQTRAWIGSVTSRISAFVALNPMTKAHAFYLNEAAEQSKYLMSGPEEMLASELSLSGGNAWSKLQGTVTSQITADFELDGKVQRMPITAIINLRGHPVEEVRRRGYEAENMIWETVKEPLAAAMNGIKGK